MFCIAVPKTRTQNTGIMYKITASLIVNIRAGKSAKKVLHSSWVRVWVNPNPIPGCFFLADVFLLESKHQC